MIPLAATDAAIADELPGAMAWARRRQIVMDTRSIPVRTLRLVLEQPESNEKFYLQATFEDYRAYPPLWQWYDASWSSTDALHLSPQDAGNRPASLGSSMFIKHGGKGLICAPFNRLAYGAHEGPHSDWGSLAQWMTAAEGYVHAVKLGDMLSAILRDFRHSSGRMR